MEQYCINLCQWKNHLEGIIPVVEDWHARQVLTQVYIANKLSLSPSTIFV